MSCKILEKNVRMSLHNFVIYTTRFNHETYIEYTKYKENKKFDGSIYNIPVYLRYNKVRVNMPLIVLDMHNDLNKICGIGIVRNQYKYIDTFQIYKDRNYNRYSYISQYYINIKGDDNYYYYERNIDNFDKTIKLLETICFTGRGHLKRGSGFTKLPLKNFDLEEIFEIKDILCNTFKLKYGDDKELNNMLYIM